VKAADGGSDFDLVVIGASLGGLSALRELLAGLPGDFAAAVAIVQHRQADAESALATLLGAVCPLPVYEPRDGERLQPGAIYLAPGGYHLLVEPGRLALSLEAPVSWARPSIDVLFESAAEAYGRRLVAVLLTGSSEDGAAGVEAVARRGGLTIVEDPGSAFSPVSPRAALDRTSVHHVLQLEAIAGLLRGMVQTAVRG
jgi:two-component system chemotaxis response regulator CheB